MRVLLVTDWPQHAGGVETYLAALAEGLRARGDEVGLLTSSAGEGGRHADYVAFGTERVVPQVVLQVANPLAARTVRRALREFRPDVAHVTMFEMHLSPSVVGVLRAAVPTVLNVAYYKPICPTGLKLLPDGSLCTVSAGRACLDAACLSVPHYARDRVRYARIGAALRGPGPVLTCSRWMRAALAAEGIDAATIPWPVRPPGDCFERRPASHPLLVYSGRLSREKGVDTLLRALARLRDEGLRVGLRVVGDGPLRASLGGLAEELGVAGSVRFAGRVAPEEVERELADAWALAAPSRWAEPLGLTAVEAIVRGIPVIASRTGGLAEVVREGESGLLFPNGNVAALATRIRDVVSLRAFPGLGLAPAVVARARAEHDLGRHTDAVRAVFSAAAARPQRSRGRRPGQ